MGQLTLHTFLEGLTGWLNAAAIPYMLAGSFASTLHGRPRSTQGVDLVIDPSELALRAFCDGVPEDRAYLDPISALEAFRRRDMFNLIDARTGWKADFIVRKDRPFSRSEFERRVTVEWEELSVVVATPEDVALSKLEWSRMSGGSSRQRSDVAGVVHARFDHTYVERWLDSLGVRDEWNLVLQEVRDL